MKNKKFYMEPDSNGRIGRDGQIKSYEAGFNNISIAEMYAKENKMTLKNYLKWWWSEIKIETPFRWETPGKGYGYEGTTVLVTKGDRIKEIYGQIMVDGLR